jgi:Asp-tRNA(Asn)/Glu-tRNA(Gln) amidotransferase A subunit family amidase
MSLVRPVSLKALLADVAAGRLAPAAAFEAFAARSAAVEPAIGAFAAADWPAARARVAAAGLPLAGLPIGVKDILDTAALPTGYGSVLHAGHRPATDAAIVRRLRAVGATLPVKTTTTEFAFLHPTATRNPHHPGHSPGGSSAGSAAAVAAGMLPAAIGTQTGGSVLRPASFCGVTGFKPGFDVLPTAGLKPFAPSLDTVGLFAAGPADVAALFAALTGRPADDAPAPAALRLAVVRTPWDGEASSGARAALDAGVARLRAAGIAVAVVEAGGNLVAADAAHGTIQAYEAARLFAATLRDHRDRLSPILADYLTAAAAVGDDAYAEALAVAAAGRAAFARLIDGIDALVTFASADRAPTGLAGTGSPRFNRLWTLLGVPAISVPGLDVDGLPIGLQLVGPAGDDGRLLATAETVATALAAG